MYRVPLLRRSPVQKEQRRVYGNAEAEGKEDLTKSLSKPSVSMLLGSPVALLSFQPFFVDIERRT